MSTIPIASQIACVERELKMRRRVYPRWVDAGKMTAAAAATETATMEAVLETLRGLPPPCRQAGQPAVIPAALFCRESRQLGGFFV